MLIVGGVSKSFMDSDILLIKVDKEGEILWSKSIGGDGFDVANAAFQNSSGDIVLGGLTTSYNNGNPDAFLSIVSQEGTVIWTKTYGGDGLDNFTDVMEAENDDIVAVGSTSSYCGFSRNIY